MTTVTQACSGKRPLVEWFAETIDCDDADAMADFRTAILDRRVTHRAADFASVEARGLLLNFRAIPDYRPPTWPSSEVPMQSHFDFVIDDPDAFATQMRALGARLAAHQDPRDPHLVVMLDPAGHPFCLIRSSAATRY